MRRALLKNVLEIIIRWQKSEIYYYEEELLILLKSLLAKEKEYISAKFCKLQWVNTSANVLFCLQQSRILTATEYLLSLNSCQNIPKILKTCMEYKMDLLANVIQNSFFNPQHSQRFQCLLKELFTTLLEELNQDPNAVHTNYLKALQPFLPDETFNAVREEHLQILFSTDKCTVREAFQNIYTWENIPPKESTLQGILNQLVNTNHTESVHLYLNLAKTPNFNGWKYYSILLRTLMQKPTDECSTMIKNNLRDLFNVFTNKCDDFSCIQMLVTARSMFSKANINAYKQWIKETIGNMKFTITAENFRIIMAVLTNIIPLEVDATYLQAHASTPISPAPLCNGLVLSYKKKCQRRLKELTKDTQKNLSEMSIVIDSD